MAESACSLSPPSAPRSDRPRPSPAPRRPRAAAATASGASAASACAARASHPGRWEGMVGSRMAAASPLRQMRPLRDDLRPCSTNTTACAHPSAKSAAYASPSHRSPLAPFAVGTVFPTRSAEPSRHGPLDHYLRRRLLLLHDGFDTGRAWPAASQTSDAFGSYTSTRSPRTAWLPSSTDAVSPARTVTACGTS